MSIKIGKHQVRFVKHGSVYFHGNVWAERTREGWRAGSWDGDDYAEVEARTLQGAYRAVARAFA